VRGLRQVVVVGGGLGGLRVVEALRREGFAGRVRLVGEEEMSPYDRPPLSKEILRGERAPETAYLRSPEKLAELDAELLLGRPARALDLARRRVELVDSASVGFDALIIATGAAPRTLPELDGLPGVYTLRTLADSLRLKDALGRARHVTVVGAGFIGSEVAASARKLGCEVTIVEPETTPLARAVGPEMGGVLMELHREHGTELRLGVTVDSADGENSGRLTLSDGTTLATDVVVVGVGVVPNTAWLEGSGLELDRGIVCGADLNAGAPGVYAVGDVASWPNELLGRRMRVEHWTNTAEQARHAVRNLLHETDAPFLGSNYVWSDQYGLRIQFVGTLGDELEVVRGSVDAREFLAWYRDGDRLVGAIAIGLPKPLMKTKRLIEERRNWQDALATLDD